MFSCGEYILRSAAAVEQTFGGITTRLWDDPFEWTLPEALSTDRFDFGIFERKSKKRAEKVSHFFNRTKICAAKCPRRKS